MTHSNETLTRMLREGWRGDTASDLMTEAADRIRALCAQRDGEGDVASGTLWRAERDLAAARREHDAQVTLRREALVQLEDANRRIDAALALHTPIDALDMGRKNAHKVQVCTGCGQDDGNWNRWPCATVTALQGSEEPSHADG